MKKYWGLLLRLAPEAALEDLGSAPVRASCGGSAAAWVAGVLAGESHGQRKLVGYSS